MEVLRTNFAVLLLSLTPILVDSAAWIPSYAGPYIANVDKLYECNEKEIDRTNGTLKLHIKMSHWNPSRPTDLQTANGNVSILKYRLDDSYWVVGTFAVRSNNMWKDNAFIFNAKKGGCSFYRSNQPRVFSSIFQRDPNSKGPCEVPVGTFYLKNLVIDWRNPNAPVLPYGHYRVNVRAGQPGRPMPDFLPQLCFSVEVRLVPKVKS